MATAAVLPPAGQASSWQGDKRDAAWPPGARGGNLAHMMKVLGLGARVRMCCDTEALRPDGTRTLNHMPVSIPVSALTPSRCQGNCRFVGMNAVCSLSAYCAHCAAPHPPAVKGAGAMRSLHSLTPMWRGGAEERALLPPGKGGAPTCC